MLQVNVLEAKTDLSKLIRLIESNRDDEIRVARNGKPVVRITAIDKKPVSKRIGLTKGKFTMSNGFNADTFYCSLRGSFFPLFSPVEEKANIIKTATMKQEG